MNRATFYSGIRSRFFPAGLTQPQVDSIESILDYWESLGVGDLRWLAYILATTYHETDGEFMPIEEYGKGLKRLYGKPDQETGKAYYGRGFVQLTWRRNYALFATRLGIDLERKPELALSLPVATRVLVDGMVNGLFTGQSLADYFPAGGDADWLNARWIVNGADRAQMIANYALAFFASLEAAEAEVMSHQAVPPTPPAAASTPDLQAVPITPSAPAATPWWARMLTSKIVWTQVVGLVAGGGILHGVDLTPDQQASIAQVISMTMGASALVLRTFFNNPK